MCRDHRCLAACQKQHGQNEPAGQVDVSDLSKNNTDRMNKLVR